MEIVKLLGDQKAALDAEISVREAELKEAKTMSKKLDRMIKDLSPAPVMADAAPEAVPAPVEAEATPTA